MEQQDLWKMNYHTHFFWESPNVERIALFLFLSFIEFKGDGGL